MISARPLELKIQQKKNRNKNNWSDFSVAYLEISHRKESENHVCFCWVYAVEAKRRQQLECEQYAVATEGPKIWGEWPVVMWWAKSVTFG